MLLAQYVGRAIMMRTVGKSGQRASGVILDQQSGGRTIEALIRRGKIGGEDQRAA